MTRINPMRIKKGSRESAELLRKLRSFLDANEPELARFLVRLWDDQGKAITYKELREAILRGDIDEDLLEQWRQDYTGFVTANLASSWENAIKTAAHELESKYPLWHFNPMSDGVKKWTETQAAEFVTSCTETQIQGIRAVVRRASVMQDMSVDELARTIRPTVGLYKEQANANLNYYKSLIAGGTPKKKALEKSVRYAARQHRYRGFLIARTELSFAYNWGAFEGIIQAQEAGYLGEVEKEWCTADEERTCPICHALDGTVVGLNEDFNFPTKLRSKRPGIRRTSPAHPSCRCTILYREKQRKD